MMFVILKVVSRILLALVAMIGTIAFLSCPPVHFIYPEALPAGPSSVYVPGGGFSGFFFHIGVFESLQDQLWDYDYYCFSSGCLNVLHGLLNRTTQEISDMCIDIQDSFHKGGFGRFDIVGEIFETFYPLDLTDQLEQALPRLHILTTTKTHGVTIVKARTRDELKQYILKTSWIPYVTGWGWSADEHEWFLDGGFTKMIHPQCEHSLDYPSTWEIWVDALNPNISRERMIQLAESGRQHRYPSLQQQQHLSTISTTTTTRDDDSREEL